ncbi:DUF255 family protein [Medicago truncatula]|uniref:DUF255 family protein n=1 Tax=Medicago truncatula TaxID=3880 RepID=A0A072UWJ9_MEDTR|nr:DUF255 family protein [Medicago truncatula]
MATSSHSNQHKFTNRLASEQSPYLLQHAHNPVDWYPWGEEAFAEARHRAGGRNLESMRHRAEEEIWKAWRKKSGILSDGEDAYN